MSDWNYAIGAENFDQGFKFIDKKTKAAYDGDWITTAKITIRQSDLTDFTVDAAMSIDTKNPMRLLYTITTASMPQVRGNYLCIVTVDDGTEKQKSWEFDLRVRRG